MKAKKISINKNHKIAIVTGGSSGIGFAITSKLIQNGIKTIIISKSQIKLDNALQKLKSINKDLVDAKRADVRNGKEISKCVDEIFRKYGKINYLINSVGVSIHGPFSKLEERDWDEVVDTNLKGVFLSCKAVWKYMLKQTETRPQIITISSASGQAGYSNGSIYCASKFGVNGLMDALYLEGQEIGIKISTVIPGPVDTQIWNLNDAEVDAARKNMLKTDAIADIVYYIISRPWNEHFRSIVLHPFAIQPFLRGRNRGPGGIFPKNPEKISTYKNKSFRI